ncbi:MAG TPA: hypothetical protein VGX91_09425 [Candidatus Cybelea sp.]|jgi:hypothetical protein|nr:hypothetical protein [Candidatus Cybelea sp.]
MKRSFLLFAALFALGTIAAQASGTITIVHKGGQPEVYDSVAIKVLHGALYVTSEDGKGTLVISRAACSHQGDLMVCLVTHATLVQAGSTSPLDLKTGTIYVNSTDDPLQLVLSTTKVPPHSIWLSMTTDRGTYVSLTGRIDKVVQ